MKAFILAGGFATRLWPLTEKRAKPLLPLAGKPIITHIVKKIPADIPVTVSTNAAFKEGFEEWKNKLGRENVEILIEDTKSDDQKLGALGAVRKWVEDENISEDVLLLTGDNYFGFQISDFLESYTEGTPILAAFDIKEKELAKSFGTVVLDSSSERATSNEQRATIHAFDEKPENPQSTLVSTGCSILPSSTLPILIEFAKEHPDNVGGIFEEFIRKGTSVECFQFSEPWFDIGSFNAYLEATQKLVGDEVIKEERASLEASECSGSIVLGINSKVSNSKLENVVMFEDCVIEDCDLSNCILDNGCELKGIDLRGKMLREGTKLVSSG